MLIARYH